MDVHAPILCSRIDAELGAVVLTVSGPMTTCEDVDAVRDALRAAPRGFSLIIELDAMTTVTTASLQCLRDMAQESIVAGVRLLLVSESIDVRANLILADLDSLAPVLHNLAQARQIVAAAA